MLSLRGCSSQGNLQKWPQDWSREFTTESKAEGTGTAGLGHTGTASPGTAPTKRGRGQEKQKMKSKIQFNSLPPQEKVISTAVGAFGSSKRNFPQILLPSQGDKTTPRTPKGISRTPNNQNPSASVQGEVFFKTTQNSQFFWQQYCQIFFVLAELLCKRKVVKEGKPCQAGDSAFGILFSILKLLFPYLGNVLGIRWMSLSCAGINNSVYREADFCRFLLFHSNISVGRETFWFCRGQRAQGAPGTTLLSVKLSSLQINITIQREWRRQ